MTMLPRKCIATSARAILVSLGIATSAFAAQPAGTLTLADGLVFAQSAEGHAKILAQGSTIGVGDKVTSGKTGYARIDLADGSYAILAPDTEVAVDARDELTLTRGSVRISGGSGLHRVNTPVGSMSGKDATFVASFVPVEVAKVAMRPVMLAALSAEQSGLFSDAPLQLAQLNLPLPPPGGASSMQPGLYVQVIDGLINLSNKGGSQSFSAGQFGYTASFVQPPTVVPAILGMQFTPPPAFSQTTNPTSTSSSKSGAVDCEVR